MSTKNFAVLGSPISHSKSPLLHNAAYEYLNIGGTYSREDVPKGGLATFLRTRRSEFDGFSITMPLKEEAFASADTHDDISARIRVANTLVIKDELLHASNTDVLGFQEIFKRLNASVLLRPYILGSGSTAKSAALALHLLGVSSIHMVARNESAVKDIQRLFPDLEIAFHAWGGSVEEASLVVSAVPEVQGITIGPNVSHIVDVNYKDDSPKILQFIQADSYSYINGLHLLVYQAVYQVLQMRGINTDRFDDIVIAMFAALEHSN